MAIIDAFLLLNELDLLEIRLNELDPVVDQFLIIEANETFSGIPKPLYFRRNRKRFAAFKDKITLWEVKDMPKSDNPWVRENHQRNAIAEALKFMKCKDNDRVVLADLDEIPRANKVLEAVNLRQPVLFELRMFYYYVNIRCVTWPWWLDLGMASVSDLLTEPQSLRGEFRADASSRMLQRDAGWYFSYIGAMKRIRRKISALGHYRRMPDKFKADTFRVVRDAGWHFSYIGGVRRIQQKVAAFSHHREYGKPEFTNTKHLKQCLAEARDLFGRNLAWKRVPLDESYPKYLLQNLDRFGYMVAPPPQDHKK